MARAHRRYTRQQKVEAVAQAEMTSTEAAAEATGIPRTTIAYWLDAPEFVELRQKTREEMRDGFRVLIHKAQARLEQLIPTMEPRDLTVLLGVATDKAQLVGGEATTRSEHRSVTHGIDDNEKRKLRDFIDGLPAEPAGEPADEGADPVGAGTEVR